MKSALFQEELSEQRRRGMTETQKFIVDTMDRLVPQCLTTSGKERRMQPIVRKVLGLVIIAVLASCAGQTEELSMQRPQQGPQPQAPQSVTFPNGTTFGGASGRQASELAQLIAGSNNDNMQDYQRLR
jgi:hypothetical protein